MPIIISLFLISMRVQRATPFHELLAKIVFLLAPTLMVCYFLLWNANEYYTILNNQTVRQTLYVAAGVLASAVFHAFRFRFLPAFLVIVLLLYLGYKGIDAGASGEFDAFFLSIQFLVLAITFVIGWLIGWGFMRLRYFPILLATAFLTIALLLIARQNELFFAPEDKDGLWRYAMLLGPVVFFAIYIIFTGELIRNYKDKQQKLWWFLTRRLAIFALLCVLLLGAVIFLMRGEIAETIANYGGGGKEGKNSMLKKNKDNTFDLQQYTRLRGSLGRSNELLFAAHIDHFFPDSDIPNPLYLTAFYYSKFDTLTETFERDSLLPLSDLFEPDPTKVPLFFTKYDSTVLQYALLEKHRTTVEIEVYKKQLSPATYVAPSTAYFLQPISVEKDFKAEFSSAYRAKSYVSELNSAYFVYNSDHPQIVAFQQQRFDILRQVKGYTGVDKRLMDYYTFMPSDAKFDRIKALAQQVTSGKQLPVDKVLAIRDYFLAKDEQGNPTYTYTDNPGVPDIPDASKLQYFLFENKKGYCAYYAGATLFMLRAMGIPSRITVGFMTVDRSNKNKGWYWYYADQAHAWVQVYFPGYGWLDFDTTVGNDDARESPAPDGTPPMQPPKAWLAADGLIAKVDTINKIADFISNRMVYHDVEYKLDEPATMQLDLRIAAIRKDSITVPLAMLKPGDSATAVSYAEVFKKLRPERGMTGTSLLKKFPAQIPTDELYVKLSPKEEKEKLEKIQDLPKATDWKRILFIVLFVLAAVALFILLVPRIILLQYQLRHQWSGNKGRRAYLAYRTASFYLHQLGFIRGQLTPLQYAQQIDKTLNTSFVSFMVPYLKLKYAGRALTDTEQQQLGQFLRGFMRQVRTAVPFKKRWWRFFHVFRAIAFYGVGSE